MKVALLGYDTEGKVSYEYYKGLGADITICDRNTAVDVPDGADSQLGDDYLAGLDRFDVLVRTAGMAPRVILEANPSVGDKITTLVNEFMRVCPTRNIIGVTGTKGKGTTSTLIAKMLEASGHTVRLGGNIGVPPFTFIQDLDKNSWVVLELSSFQLMDLRYSPRIGVCLMIVPEHLNWHEDMDEYTGAKAQLFAHQSSDDIAIYFAENDLSKEIVSTGAGHTIPYYTSPGAWVDGDMITIDGTEICTTGELRLLGAHNWQNACAALTAYWQVDQNVEAVRSVLRSFTGLQYHIELVRELDGVQYYNDGFGTTPETTIVALQAFNQPKVIILGGSDKGVPFDELAREISNSNIRQVILMGNSSNTVNPTVSFKVEAALRSHGVKNITSIIRDGGPSMQEVLEAAQAAAQPGDVVLLSAGCASFDMFKNYKDRGAQFTTAVNKLS